jgi:hypothetical protein
LKCKQNLEKDIAALREDGRNEDAVAIRQLKTSNERLTKENQDLFLRVKELEGGKRKAIKEELEKILNQGYNVSLDGRERVYQSEVDDYNRWRAKAEGFVRVYRGESDVKRFQQGGLPMLEEFLKDYLD